MGRLAQRTTHRMAIGAAGALLIPGLVVAAATAPATAGTNDQTVSGVASPIWQTNQPVNALAVANGVIYAGGKFTSVRPPGSTAGTNETPRSFIAAFNASTGALITTFNLSLNGQVNALEVSPDQSRLYIGGNFSTVNGAALRRLAAYNLTTGAIDPTFAPNPDKPVLAIESTNSTVYVGGSYTTIRGTNQAYLASVRASNGAVNTAFAPTFATRPPSTCPPNQPTCTVTTYLPSPRAVKLSPDGSRLLVGGNFVGVNGANSGGMASLDPITGATEPWAANDPTTGQPINTNCVGRVTDIAVQGSQAFVTGEGDPPGCYEGIYAANISDGSMNWLSSCLGGSQGLTILNGVIYKASHQHDCAFSRGGAFGGFVGGTSRDGFVHHYLVGQDITDGGFVHWTPNTNATGSPAIGPHVIANDGNQLIVGGDFALVNGQRQYGLTRFLANGNHATPVVPGRSYNNDPWPNTVAHVVENLAVTVQPTAAGTLTVQVPASDDADSGTLSYQIYRDNGTTPIATLSAESYTWSRPILRYDDRGLVPGSTHSYRVTASDGTFTSPRSTAVSGRVGTSAPPPFASLMSSLNPLSWWRLDGNGDDSSATGSHPADLVAGVTTGVPGALGGNGAVTLDGSTGYLTSDNQISAPNAFSESVWFKTTSTLGGSLVAQSTNQTGQGGTTDRAITRDNNGGLVFAVRQPGAGSPFGPAVTSFRNQGTVWNDGKWHQAVGVYSNGTVSLYVDGQLQGSATATDRNGNVVQAAGMPSSYLRVGDADLSQIQSVFGINFYHRIWPMSQFLGGSVDEPAAFDQALTAAQVQSMYAAAVAGGA